MRASNQIRANTDFQYTYNSRMYQFYVTGSSFPDPYYFNSDVIEYVIENSAKGLNYSFQETGFYLLDWSVQTSANIAEYCFDLFRNSFIWTRSLIQDYVYSGASAYSWDFECTGIDSNDPASGDYGTAYGFRFKGLCGDTIDVKLDSSGNFYGHSTGNFTYGNELPDYIPHIIHQMTPDNIWVPSGYSSSIEDYPAPYIEGTTLHFFLCVDGSTSDVREVTVSNFQNTYIITKDYFGPSGSMPQIRFYKKNSLWDSEPLSISYNPIGQGTRQYQTIHFASNVSEPLLAGQNVFCSYLQMNQATSYMFHYGLNLPSGRFTGASSGSTEYVDQVYYAGFKYLNSWAPTWIQGNNFLFLKSMNITPITNHDPDPLPYGTPIPVDVIPDSPDDPLPQNLPDPEPIPGITYPEPTPLPLPPFASIVSGNDELWGVTLDFDGAQNSLLPYLNSLATFEFPSFDDLINDFSGSIIWVAQLMSVLYNGTSFNVLFVVLCLFSLVSIIIGGYKLWTTTEPDPNNPGFRRTKRPPKGPKGRRKR